MNAVTGRVKKDGCFASSSYLPSAELPASMDLDVVFLPIPIIKRKRVAWGLKWLEVKACQQKEPRIRVSSSSADSQAEMSPTSAISKHLEKEKAAKSCQAYKQHRTQTLFPAQASQSTIISKHYKNSSLNHFSNPHPPSFTVIKILNHPLERGTTKTDYQKHQNTREEKNRSISLTCITVSIF